jgi:hypothetical protein
VVPSESIGRNQENPESDTQRSNYQISQDKNEWPEEYLLSCPPRSPSQSQEPGVERGQERVTQMTSAMGMTMSGGHEMEDGCSSVEKEERFEGGMGMKLRSPAKPGPGRRKRCGLFGTWHAFHTRDRYLSDRYGVIARKLIIRRYVIYSNLSTTVVLGRKGNYFFFRSSSYGL